MINSSRQQFRCVLSVSLFFGIIAVTQSDVCAQDIQAVGARLAAAGEKVKDAVAKEKVDSKDMPFVILARWHKAKERILTKAVSAGEITEKEADYLRIEIVKAEAREAKAQSDLSPKGKVTAEQMVKSMDANNNGKIEKSEASEDLKLYFDHYDRNKSGEIDQKEAEAIANYVNRR